MVLYEVMDENEGGNFIDPKYSNLNMATHMRNFQIAAQLSSIVKRVTMPAMP